MTSYNTLKKYFTQICYYIQYNIVWYYLGIISKVVYDFTPFLFYTSEDLNQRRIKMAPLAYG
jgi:hypothetical protein